MTTTESPDGGLKLAKALHGDLQLPCTFGVLGQLALG